MTSAEGLPAIQRKADSEVDADALVGGTIDPLRGQPEGLDGDTTRVQPKLVQAQMDSARSSPLPWNPAGLDGGGGAPLSPAARRYMEPRFGFDFGDVRVHHDTESDRLSRSIGAAAFTHGRHVYFRNGRLDPSSESGRRLLAHELTHVVQQAGGTAAVRRSPDASTGPVPHIQGISPGNHGVQCQLEVHANLREPQQVRIYESGASDVDYTTSAGPNTEDLISCNPHSIIGKNVGPTDRWGLYNFAQITQGGIAFHSNRCDPRRRTLCADGETRYCEPSEQLDDRVAKTLIVDGTSRSHGCLRLRDADSASLFSRVSVGTRVFVYARRSWRSPSWSSSEDRAGGPACSE